MKTRRSLFAAYIILITLRFSFSQDLITRTDPVKYIITAKATVRNSGFELTKLILILPLPQTNIYQDIEIVDTKGAEVLDLGGTDDKYLRYRFDKDGVPGKNGLITVTYVFKATLYTINADPGVIGKIYPYNKDNAQYKLYTAKNGNIIDTSDPEMNAEADKLWAGSKNALDYAEKCYEYVATNYRYLEPNTGIHTLDEILGDGGGDCGNLSTLFVTLLRIKGIPARHLVSKRPDSSDHIWSDFYLERYGWVPADVTYRNGNPGGDYFGKVDVGDNGVILNKTVGMKVFFDDYTPYDLSLLQNPAYWYWYSSGSGEITTELKFVSKKIP